MKPRRYPFSEMIVGDEILFFHETDFINATMAAYVYKKNNDKNFEFKRTKDFDEKGRVITWGIVRI